MGKLNLITKRFLKKPLLLLVFLLISAHGIAQTTTQNYISKYQQKAVEIMEQHGVPASIVLAVAIHESASGTSKIARYLNNHFGLKGPNRNTKIRSAYRDFDTPQHSYDYFIAFLQNRPKLKTLFGKYSSFDYKNWAYGIQRGGYAASRTWAAEVLSIIKKNNLSQFDGQAPLADSLSINAVTPPLASPINYYTVKKGDTLGAIAKKHQTTVKSLISKNNLKSTLLRVGQTLAIYL